MSPDSGEPPEEVIETAVATARGSRHLRLRYLPDSVSLFARTAGSSPAVTFVEYGMRRDTGRREKSARTMDYAELDERARSVAAVLQRRCEPGDRVAVLCPHEPGYVVAFLACLYAGVIAVPLYAPEALRSNERLRSVMGDCAPRCVLTVSAVRPSVQRLLDEMGGMGGMGGTNDVGGTDGTDGPPAHLVCVDEVSPEEAGSWRRPPMRPDDVAYLQYTSGSTGAPAGVRVTHLNLAVTNHQIRAHWPSSVIASWVPFFHDFGLVCGITNPLGAGAHSVNLSPMAFVQDPYRWLRMISDYRADWSITPSSSLVQCVRRVTGERRSELDLSSLRLLTIAAEPVYAESTEAFTSAFAAGGLSATAPSPCYGLAEATLPVSAPPVGEGMTDRSFDRDALAAGVARELPPGSPNTVRIVSCGTPSLGVSVRIRHREGLGPLPDGRVGEIWVSGPNVADGYWNRPERSAEVFEKHLVEPDGDLLPGPWLRTGDLGFLLEGRVHVVGRAKDMIIVRGRNHYPDDIEATVQAARAGREAGAAGPAGPAGNIASEGSAAAFSAGIDGEERLVVLVEAEPALLTAGEAEVEVILRDLRQEITRNHGLAAHDLVLVRRGTLPRTTSGKIRRGACREQYLRGEFDR
ncbi:fatty acyl-AMP ligase [Streptosporangium sp. NPDC002721]|uniref:fatty acyl-AMP ligase n=1 Tax=Streptosporangium sp. NPDC002721 TaxID=3366188 RepID=UPI0036C06CDC